MQTITRNKSAKLKLAAANLAAATALADNASDYDLIHRIVLDGDAPTPAQLDVAIAAAKRMRCRLATMSSGEKFPNWPNGPEHPLVTLDDRVWAVAYNSDLSPEARAVVRAAGHRTPAPACGQPLPAVWLREPGGGIRVIR